MLVFLCCALLLKISDFKINLQYWDLHPPSALPATNIQYRNLIFLYHFINKDNCELLYL
jgi:hypothetical protein